MRHVCRKLIEIEKRAHPDLTVKELAEMYFCSEESVRQVLRPLGLLRKWRRVSMPAIRKPKGNRKY